MADQITITTSEVAVQCNQLYAAVRKVTKKDYNIVASCVLGQGSQGIVYLGQLDGKLDVAVKTFKSYTTYETEMTINVAYLNQYSGTKYSYH